MKISRFLIIIICCTVLMGCVTQDADVTQKEKQVAKIYCDYPYYSSVDALTEKADLIIKGTIMDSRVEENDYRIEIDEENKLLNPGGKTTSHNFVHTVYTVSVSESYKGDVEPDEIIEVKEMGGETETTKYIAEESVTFTKNKEYVMFLATYENGIPSSLLNPIQGAYIYEEEAEDKGKLSIVNEKNDLALTIEDLEEIKNNQIKNN